MTAESVNPAAPALGMSLQVDLGAGRVCTLQTFVPSECTVVELNRMLDKLTAAGARQRAAYRIEELERDLEKFEREQAQHKEDLATIDVAYDAAQKQRQADIERAQISVANMEKAVEEQHKASGRRGPAELKGTAKANADRVNSGIEKLKGEIAAAQAEHDKAHSESEKTMERRAALIEKTRAEMVRCQEIVAAGLKA